MCAALFFMTRWLSASPALAKAHFESRQNEACGLSVERHLDTLADLCGAVGHHCLRDLAGVHS